MEAYFWNAGVLASDTSKARLQCGSLLYWLVVLSVVPFILALAAGVRTYLLRKWAVKERNGWVWTEGDVHWTPAATLIYPAICSLAGLVAGLFGIGGGVVKVGNPSNDFAIHSMIGILQVNPLESCLPQHELGRVGWQEVTLVHPVALPSCMS